MTIHAVLLIMMMTMMTSDMTGEPQDELVFPCCLFKKSTDLDSRAGAGDLDILASG